MDLGIGYIKIFDIPNKKNKNFAFMFDVEEGTCIHQYVTLKNSPTRLTFDWGEINNGKCS